MSQPNANPSPEPTVVVLNPGEDCSPTSFREMIDALLAGPKPELGTVDAAAAVRAERLDSQP